jgi:polysaccharide biosynthesis protein PslH
MRVLIISRQFPWPLNSGGSQRIFHFVRALARQHQVTVLTLAAEPIPPDVLQEFERASGGGTRVLTFDGADCAIRNSSLYWGNAAGFVRRVATSPFPIFIHDWWSKSLMATLAGFFRDNAFDLVVTRDPSFAEQARSAGFQRIILDADDLFSILLKQQLLSAGKYRRKALHRIDAVKARIYDRRTPRRFERVIIAKDDDRRHFPASLHDKIVVVPNGIDLPTPVGQKFEEPNRMLFVGTLSYGPNVDAVCYLAREVMPRLWADRPEAMLDIVGRGPPDPEVLGALGDPRLHLHESPPDLRPFYQKATLVVAPIREGSGTRIKVIEALSYEKALVSTTFAPEGLGLEPGTHFVAADTPADFARACLDLLANPSRRKALGTLGREFTAKHFDWERIEETIGAVVEGRLPRG